MPTLTTEQLTARVREMMADAGYDTCCVGPTRIDGSVTACSYDAIPGTMGHPCYGVTANPDGSVQHRGYVKPRATVQTVS